VGTLTTTNNTDATDLAAALTTGGAGGITITGETLSANSNGVDASAGTFSTSGTNNYGLQGSGIVISNGDAATDGTSGPFIQYYSVAYGVPATASQTNLLSQVSSARNFNDVTEFDITFVAGANTNHVFFNTVCQLNTRNTSANTSTALACFSMARISRSRVEIRSTSTIRVW
jgi:hypothetical protein